MHTITTTALSPLVVTAIARVDDCARIDGLSVDDWLTRYWRARIYAILPQPHDENPALALSGLADALAIEDITEAVDFTLDYREFTGRPTNDETLSRMMLETLLDWSKWTFRTNIDDARAQDWLRSILT